MALKKLILIPSLVLAMATAFTGCSLFPTEDPGITPPIRTVGPSVSYQTYTIKKGDVIDEVRNATATVINPITYDCFFTLKDYRFKEYPYKSGDSVVAGNLVAVADTATIEGNIKETEYLLKGYELDMQRLKSTGGDPYAIEKLQLDIDYNNGKLQGYRSQLNGSSISAPAAGMITYLDMTLKSGDMITPDKTLVRISDISQVYIEYRVEAANASKYKIGMPVVIRQNSKEYAGEVIMTPEALPEGSTETTQKIKIVFKEIPPGGGFVSTGLTVNIVFDKRVGVVIVPKNMVAIDPTTKVETVMTLDGENKVQKVITTGLKSGLYYEVLSGLTVGDIIIVPNL